MVALQYDAKRTYFQVKWDAMTIKTQPKIRNVQYGGVYVSAHIYMVSVHFTFQSIGFGFG